MNDKTVDMEYGIDFHTGKFICGKCQKRFSAYYIRKKEYGRTISKVLRHSAKANFYRHLKSCYKMADK